MKQATVSYQPSLSNTFMKDAARDLDGVDNFMHQKIYDDQDGLTLLPDGPLYILVDGSAASQLPGTPADYINTTATHVIVWKDSSEDVIAWGYPRVADAAESWTEKVANGDMEVAVAVFDAEDVLGAASEVQSAVQKHGGANSSLITRTTVGTGSFTKDYYDTNANRISNNQLGRIHCWVYLPSGQTISSISIRFYDGLAFSVLQTITSTDTWVEVGPYYVLPQTLFKFQIRGVNGAQNDIFYIDDLSIESVDNIGTSAAHIYDDPAGSNQNWTGIGTGDPNDPKTLEVLKSDFQITGALSAFMWVKPDDGQPGSQLRIISKNRITDGFRSFQFYIESAGELTVYLSSDGAGNNEKESTDDAFFSDGQETWHHVGFVYNGATVVIYGDGVALASATGTAIPASIHDTSEKLTIGALSTPSNYFAGLIGPTVFASRDYSADEASRLFNADRARFGL